MNDQCWLILNAKGVQDIRKGRRAKWHDPERPALKQGEYAVLIDITVPDAVFRPRASLTAKVVVPEEAVVEGPIAVEVVAPPDEGE